jgi:hypothetical protein
MGQQKYEIIITKQIIVCFAASYFYYCLLEATFESNLSISM